ncbi:hypothetical protein MTO96_009317 [Rhipicephalus appendiculatus]
MRPLLPRTRARPQRLPRRSRDGRWTGRASPSSSPGGPVQGPVPVAPPRSEDEAWPRSWCPSLDSGPKPPVEGGTSCVAFSAGNERDASSEPYPPSGSDVLADTLPRRR